MFSIINSWEEVVQEAAKARSCIREQEMNEQAYKDAAYDFKQGSTLYIRQPYGYARFFTHQDDWYLDYLTNPAEALHYIRPLALQFQKQYHYIYIPCNDLFEPHFRELSIRQLTPLITPPPRKRVFTPQEGVERTYYYAQGNKTRNL